MRSHAHSEVCAPDKCCSSLDMIPLSASKRATTSPHAGNSINSTTRLPYESLDRASPECTATSPSTVPLATHNTRDQRRGVPDELWVKEAVQKTIHMSSLQQKACLKCGLHPTAGAQLRRCGSCLAVKYCSSTCQTEDWASHRLVCKSVGAARKEEVMPLLCAAGDGDVAMVEKLLKAGAKVDGGTISAKNQEASLLFTPLFAAAVNGRATVIAALLKAGAKVNRTTTGGLTPLFMAAQEGHRAAVSVLVGAGAEIDVVTNKKCTPLFVAAQNGHEAVLAVLIKAGADVNYTRDNGCSPVFIAVQNDHLAVLAMLMKAGADINQARDNGCTPLFMAAQENNKTVLATLLKAGADVNSGRDSGCTPLFIAAAQGHEAVLVALLEAGALITAMDDGYTPLMAATNGGHTSVVAVLRRWTAGIRH